MELGRVDLANSYGGGAVAGSLWDLVGALQRLPGYSLCLLLLLQLAASLRRRSVFCSAVKQLISLSKGGAGILIPHAMAIQSRFQI